MDAWCTLVATSDNLRLSDFGRVCWEACESGMWIGERRGKSEKEEKEIGNHSALIAIIIESILRPVDPVCVVYTSTSDGIREYGGSCCQAISPSKGVCSSRGTTTNRSHDCRAVGPKDNAII